MRVSNASPLTGTSGPEDGADEIPASAYSLVLCCHLLQCRSPAAGACSFLLSSCSTFHSNSHLNPISTQFP